MDLPVTLGLAGVALGLTVLFGALGARPARPLAAPRLMPWRFMMLLAFLGVVAMLVHAVALLRAAR